MVNWARGYIASGEFNGYRAPQHLQNQVVKNYCDSNQLVFVLSRAEYWINGSTQCQLWAALNEDTRILCFSAYGSFQSLELKEKIFITTALNIK